MKERILILGGRGRIGSSVAEDLIMHTQAQITITGRSPQTAKALKPHLGQKVEFLLLDLADVEKLHLAIAAADLVIDCAGPFHSRDTSVLETCINQGVNYIDVSDHRSYTIQALNLQTKAVAAGVTAIINTGIFPGISNSMVRQGIEQFETPEKIHLSYLVSGSGGAGKTVMRTTFLSLQNQFTAWVNNEWELVQPYTDRENIYFPPPYGNCGVYWFDMPETYTIPSSFPEVKTVITKFGSVPDFYNHLTWITANIFPKWLIRQNYTIEFLSHISYQMTNFTNIFSGIGVGICSQVSGYKDGKLLVYQTNLYHEHTAIAAAAGTGSIAQLLLEGKINKPGIFPVEKALSTDLFMQFMQSRGIKINHGSS